MADDEKKHIRLQVRVNPYFYPNLFKVIEETPPKFRNAKFTRLLVLLDETLALKEFKEQTNKKDVEKAVEQKIQSVDNADATPSEESPSAEDPLKLAPAPQKSRGSHPNP